MIPDLIACFATLGGPFEADLQSGSPWDFRERAEAAAAAGYRGIGVMHSDLIRMQRRYSLNDIALILADNGLIHLELEPLLDWSTGDGAQQSLRQVHRDLLLAAEVLGARHIKAAGDLGGKTSLNESRAAFAALARQARDAGTTIALEPIAFSNIKDLPTAIEVLGDTVGSGGGLLIDAWHMTRGAFPLDDIAGLPANVLIACEMDDGALEARGDALSETLNDRRLCGEGEFDLRGFISAAALAGFDGPWGVEIYSLEHRRLPLAEAARLSFEAAARQFHSMESIS